MVEFSNDLILDMLLKLRDAFDHMMPHNKLPVVFDFIILYIIIIKDIQAELQIPKKAQAGDSG